MLILLPPSEGKADGPASAPPVALESLVHADVLTEARALLVAELEALAVAPPEIALDALGLTERQTAELDRNALLSGAPVAPAAEIYTGILFRHLDLGSLTAAQRRRARERVRIMSALWGVLGLDDEIPAYRLSASARVGPPGGLGAFWRPLLDRALAGTEGLIVDCRSGPYRKLWRPPPAATVVTIEATDKRGRRVSHMAKAVRGAVTRRLLYATRAPRTPRGLLAHVDGLGDSARLVRPDAAGRPWTLELRGADLRLAAAS